MALASPAALAQIRGPQIVVNPPEPEKSPQEIIVGDTRYVLIGDRAVRKEHWEWVQQGKGYISDTNDYVPREEHDMAMKKLDDMLGAGNP